MPRCLKLGDVHAPQSISPKIARALIRNERVSLIAMSHQLAASEWLDGLDPERKFPDVTSAVLPLLQFQFQLMFDAEQLATLSSALGVPAWPALPVAEREPPPAPREWPEHRVLPPSHRVRTLRLDAFTQHPEWSLPVELIDHDPEARLLARIDAERVALGWRGLLGLSAREAL